MAMLEARQRPGLRIVPIPGENMGEQETIHAAHLGDVKALLKRFKIRVSDGHDTSGAHSPTGQHPKGEAIDIVPDDRRGGSWADVDAAMKWAAGSGLFNQVIYDGRWGTMKLPGHGTPTTGGNHGHLGFKSGEGGAVFEKLTGKSTASPLDPAIEAVTGAPGAVVDAAAGAASAAAKATLGLALDTIGQDGARAALYVVLVLGGCGLVIAGLVRASGVSPMPIAAAAASKGRSA